MAAKEKKTGSGEVLLMSQGNGMILAQNGMGPAARSRNDSDKTQRWTLEWEDDGEYFGIKNASTGMYVRAKAANAGAPTYMSKEKGLWTFKVQKECAPGAVSIHPKEFPNSVLNHREGYFIKPGSNGDIQTMNQFDVSLQSLVACWAFVLIH